jgi:hypothetical protein
MDHVGQPADWILYANRLGITSKSMSGDKSDQMNADALLQLERIRLNELVATEHIDHSHRLY